MEHILQLLPGERLAVLTALPVEGTSSVMRKVTRVKRAVKDDEVDARYTTQQLHAMNKKAGDEPNLMEVKLDEDTFVWFYKAFNDKQNFPSGLSEWVVTLEDKLLEEHGRHAANDK